MALTRGLTDELTNLTALDRLGVAAGDNFDATLAKLEKHSVYERIVDPTATPAGRVYATLALALAAAEDGDRILVRGSHAITAGLTLSDYVANGIEIEWAPEAYLTIAGTATRGLVVDVPRARLIRPWLRASGTALAYAIEIAAADCRVERGILEVNNVALALSAALLVSTGGERSLAELGINVLAGTVSADFEDNVGSLRGSFAR